MLRLGLPVAQNLSARDTLIRVWYWARIEMWPPTPTLEKKESLLRSAQARVDYGCVLHVTSVASDTVAGEDDLYVHVRSGVQGGIVHKVRVRYLLDGEAAMPRCDCVNANLLNNWKWCAHMLAVVFMTERIRSGFERVVYSDDPREFVEPEHRKEFFHLAKLYEVKQAEKIVRGRLEEQAKVDGLWKGSKIEYLRSFSMRSIQVEDVPIFMQLVARGEAPNARKPRKKKEKKSKKKKKDKVEYNEEEENDSVSEQEAREATVPKKKDRSMSNEEYRQILNQNAGRKVRKKKEK